MRHRGQQILDLDVGEWFSALGQVGAREPDPSAQRMINSGQSGLIVATLTRTTCANRNEWELSLLGGGEKLSASAIARARSVGGKCWRARRGGRRTEMSVGSLHPLRNRGSKGLCRPLVASLGDLVFVFAEY